MRYTVIYFNVIVLLVESDRKRRGGVGSGGE